MKSRSFLKPKRHRSHEVGVGVESDGSHAFATQIGDGVVYELGGDTPLAVLGLDDKVAKPSEGSVAKAGCDAHGFCVKVGNKAAFCSRAAIKSKSSVAICHPWWLAKSTAKCSPLAASFNFSIQNRVGSVEIKVGYAYDCRHTSETTNYFIWRS